MANHPVEYRAPEAKLIDRFVRLVCRDMGEYDYGQRDIRDFGHFMKHLSNAVAQGMTSGEFDNGID